MSTAVNEQRRPLGEGYQARALLVGVVLLAVCAIAGLFSPAQFFRSYLVGYLFWLGVTLGSMVLLMLQYLTGGTWGIVIRRILEASSRNVPLMAVLFLPLLLGLHFDLYSWVSWSQPKEIAVEKSLEPKSAQEAPSPEIKSGEPDLMSNKRFYFQIPFYLARAAGYFAIWLSIAFLLNWWSAQQEKDPTRKGNSLARCRALSGPGIVLYGATITFAAIDWVMSLNPEWNSSIYPVLFAVGEILTALAFTLTVLVLVADRPPLSEIITPSIQRDLGNLLLAFVMLWAYMSISQYLLIWSGNLPEEIVWYTQRSEGAWKWVAILLALLHFALPFLLLLSKDIKENRRNLASVAIGLLVMRFLDVFWWVEPAFSHQGQYFYWFLDIAVLIGLGGIWVYLFIWQLKRRPLLPLHDPYLVEVLHHE